MTEASRRMSLNSIRKRVTSEIIDELTIYVPAIGRMTPSGYGVAFSDPIKGTGWIFWYRDRRAFHTAGVYAREHRANGLDRSELSFSDTCQSFPDGDHAIRALVEHQGPKNK